MGKALGIFKHHSGLKLTSKEMYIVEDKFSLAEENIGTSIRIGVEGAGPDGLLPYRFYIRGNTYVSGTNR